MKYFFRVLAVIYVLIAALAILIGITGFVSTAWQGLFGAALRLGVFIVIAGVLVFGAREAWKDTQTYSLLRYVSILLPGLLLGGYFVVESLRIL